MNRATLLMFLAGALLLALPSCGAVKEAADLVQWDNSQGHH